MIRLPDILCISSIDWDFIWQGHQEIMSSLAARGHRVLFIENTGVRAPQMSDLPRLGHRIQNWWRGTKGFRQERPNVFVYAPLVLPLPYSRVARWVNRWILLRAIRRWIRATGFYRPIIWTFLPTPLAHDLIKALDPLVTVYYCIDDFRSSSTGASRIGPSEERMFREADLVFVTSANLRDRAARYSSHVHLFPFGVSLERFEAVRTSAAPPPADVVQFPRPIVGYVGGLHQWLDQDLLASVAAQMPEASFVMVGPAQTDTSTLKRCPNIHLLGQRSPAELPSYVKAFDVGIVPYRRTDYTANVYPTKLNEYLSMGIPVVATDLPEIRRFNTDHGDIVAMAEDAGAFVKAIRTGLAVSSSDIIERRRQAAHTNSWENRISAMTREIERAADDAAAGDQVWGAALLRVFQRATRHSVQVALVIVAAYLLVFQTNLVWWLAAPLAVAESPRPSDAIVVFAGGVGESGQAGGGYQERVKQAVDLYRAGFAPRMIFSSGYAFAFKEAEVMKSLAVANGVPEGAILLEERAANTRQNVEFVRDILARERLDDVLLVSSPYHMRRAVLTWRRLAPGIAVTPTPVSQSQFYLHDRGASLDQIRGILHEYAAIAAYRLRGWI